MHNRRLLSICALFAALIPFVGCKSSPPNPNQGFTMSTLIETQNSVGGPGPYAPMPNMLVLGQYVANGGGSPGGSVASYEGYTALVTASDGTVSANYYVSNGIAPAYWNHEVWVPSYCLIPTSPIYLRSTQLFPAMNEFEDDNVWTTNLEDITWYCYQYVSSVPQASSRFAIAGSVPTSVTLSGLEPFSTQYGPPIMYVFSGTSGAPNLAATVTASSVNSGDASATFPLPSSLHQGGYFFVTENMGSTGEYEFNSWNLYSIASSQSVAGNPFGVSVSGQTLSGQTCTTVTVAGRTETTCTPVSGYGTAPVVSLYSSDQVLIGSTAVSVGANPTAVSVYPAPAVTKTTTTSSVTLTETFSGTTRAVVANSGSNTVSVLDLVNKDLLFNVTVGNQPVALVTSSTGSTAYVANYTDSTVTEVNLSTGAATATVAVGGHPTSVALTSGGTLWVGGVGFLTEINTSNMSVTGTETVSGKTIVSLGYTDAYNELIISSVDTSGNVYAEELTSSTFQAGGTYAPTASQVVSTVGTYVNPVTQQSVQGYSATLATVAHPVLNTNQPGAPPLVVQDGWAVVTATPTGFTITDASSNEVLVSQTTSSPITAIAVDTNLNVVYLTMPDSNTLLTVPLPGVN
jgi:YVTN family beta-propeller protein